MRTELKIHGFRILKSCLDRNAQLALLSAVRPVLKAAPLFSPDTPYGRPMSVRMTSAGRLGWYSDRAGYRYVGRHPNGVRWPDMPREVLDIWDCVTGLERRPDCCQKAGGSI